jgi:hypothetical protein
MFNHDASLSSALLDRLLHHAETMSMLSLSDGEVTAVIDGKVRW